MAMFFVESRQWEMAFCMLNLFMGIRHEIFDQSNRHCGGNLYGRVPKACLAGKESNHDPQ